MKLFTRILLMFFALALCWSVPPIKSEAKASLPVKFNLQEEYGLLQPKNQGGVGCCLITAAVSAMETKLRMKGDTTNLNWAELAVTTRNYKDGDKIGGNDWSTTRWAFSQIAIDGVRKASSYGASEMKKYFAQRKATETPVFTRQWDIVRITEIKMGNVTNVKEAIMKNGAVVVTISMNLGSGWNSPWGNGRYYQWSVPKSNGSSITHEVSIIGWDDSFPGSIFGQKKDGAWLAINSYGSDVGAGPKTERGCFWISYYDSSLLKYEGMQFQITKSSGGTVLAPTTYEAAKLATSLKRRSATATYTAEKNGKLEAVGVYAYGQTDFKCTVKVFINGSLKATNTVAMSAGYLRIPIKTVAVKKGNRIKIEVSFNKAVSVQYGLKGLTAYPMILGFYK